MNTGRRLVFIQDVSQIALMPRSREQLITELLSRDNIMIPRGDQGLQNKEKTLMIVIGGTDSSRQLKRLCHRLFKCFDFVKIRLPDVDKRKSILRACIEKLNNVDDTVLTGEFLTQLAQRTDGYSLRNLRDYVHSTALAIPYQQHPIMQNQMPILQQQNFIQMLDYSSDSASSSNDE